MTERYTKKDAERSLVRLADTLGKRLTKFDHTPEDIGTYYLDYNPTYGGCRVNKVCNEGYGVDTPFGMSRCKPSEFCRCVEYAIGAIREVKT
ncbi:hypothetical protein LCGC14_2833860 [marine sediment metagenome]|uniref:Uncharacterized protein n=1 Tax=marine sediment metagenome TaxID=412755 RepID=A0A0F9ALR8_9ZZZZ